MEIAKLLPDEPNPKAVNVMVIMCVCVYLEASQACQLQHRYHKCLYGLTQSGSVLVFFHMDLDES